MRCTQVSDKKQHTSKQMCTLYAVYIIFPRAKCLNMADMKYEAVMFHCKFQPMWDNNAKIMLFWWFSMLLCPSLSLIIGQICLPDINPCNMLNFICFCRVKNWQKMQFSPNFETLGTPAPLTDQSQVLYTGVNPWCTFACQICVHV